MAVEINCQFWAVGQGVFSSGRVSIDNHQFNWVYDCGSKNKRELDREIGEMNKNYTNIDLLAISHFDDDHINGINKLLKKVGKVRYFLLPYYQLWERLIIAKYLGIKSDDNIFGFYVNPVKYLLSKFENIETILILTNSDSNNSFEEVKPYRDDLGLEFKTINKISDEFDDYNEVIWINHSGMIYRGEVEFIPYNIAFSKLRIRPLNKNNFILSVSNLISQGNLDIIKLQNLYDKYFVTKSTKKLNRNIISLFLYVSPLLDKKINKLISSYTCKHMLYSNQNNIVGNSKSAILYGGDGELDNNGKLTDLISFLGNDRISNLFCFQVVHHGSISNWHLGLARNLQPNISVFCANPMGNYHHPHSAVLIDFLPYNPIIVDKVNRLSMYIKII